METNSVISQLEYTISKIKQASELTDVIFMEKLNI